MGVGRRFRKKPLRRPKKTGRARRRREKVQRKRLIALGASEAAVNRLKADQVRRLLRRPVRVVKALKGI